MEEHGAPIFFGITPVKEFELRISDVRDNIFPIDSGIDPVNELSPKFKSNKNLSVPTELGIAPCMRLLSIRIDIILLDHLLIETGIGPWRKFELTSNDLNLCKSPIALGRVPDNPRELRETDIILV